MLKLDVKLVPGVCGRGLGCNGWPACRTFPRLRLRKTTRNETSPPPTNFLYIAVSRRTETAWASIAFTVQGSETGDWTPVWPLRGSTHAPRQSRSARLPCVFVESTVLKQTGSLSSVCMCSRYQLFHIHLIAILLLYASERVTSSCHGQIDHALPHALRCPDISTRCASFPTK